MMEPVEPLIKCFYVFLLKCQQASKVQRTPIWRVSPSVTQRHAKHQLFSQKRIFLIYMYSLKILSQNMWDVCTAVGLDGKKSFQYLQYLIFNFQTDNDKFSLQAFHRCLFDLKVSSIHRTWLSLNLQKTWSWSGPSWLFASFSAPLWPAQYPVHQTPLRYAMSPFPSMQKLLNKRAERGL